MSKKDKKELLRVQNVLENDRMWARDSYLELLKKDLNKVLKDYFEFREEIDIKIEKISDRYRVEFNIFATRILGFEYIPKQ